MRVHHDKGGKKMRGLKKFGALVLTGAMAVSAMAGCGGSAGDGAQTSGGGNDGGTANTAGTESTGQYDGDGKWTGETSHIVMTLITGGTDPVDMQKVQDAVNEISVEEIGVEVEFKPVSVFDAPSQVPMWIGAGEQIDLMACAFTGLSPFIDMNMIEPLEEWIPESAPGIQKMQDDGLAVYDTTSDEHVYGIRNLYSTEGSAGAYLFPVDALEAAGYSYENWDAITLDELGEIFGKIKEQNPESYMGIIGTIPPSGYTICMDSLGATPASGVLIGTDSTEVVNYYASDEYYDYLTHVRDWYEKGYILKDAATTDVNLNDNIKNGTFIGNFCTGNYGLIDAKVQDTAKEWIALLIQEPYMPSIAPAANAYWTVPVTAADPGAAMRFLNLMETDTRVTNLLLWGIEGDHYTLSDAGTMEKADNYVNWALLNIHGNQRIGVANGEHTAENDAKWNERVMENPTMGLGFTYDASAMTNQLTAVQAVITEYQAALETGSVDLDTVYPEFLAKLEANGINEIIADKQAQFDAWRMEQ